MYARSAERQDPTDVIGREKVPRRPKDVRSQDGSVAHRPLHAGVGDTTSAKAERPFRARVVLRLNRAEPGHDCLRAAELGARQLVIPQSDPNDLRDHFDVESVRSACGDVCAAPGIQIRTSQLTSTRPARRRSPSANTTVALTMISR